MFATGTVIFIAVEVLVLIVGFTFRVLADPDTRPGKD